MRKMRRALWKMRDLPLKNVLLDGDDHREPRRILT
jgi:hypothetical protein